MELHLREGEPIWKYGKLKIFLTGRWNSLWPASEPCLATEEDHSDEALSSKECSSPSVSDTRLPNPEILFRKIFDTLFRLPSQKTCEWCTFSSESKLPRTRDWPTVTAALRTLDCWKFSDYTLKQQIRGKHSFVLTNQMRVFTWRNLADCGRMPPVSLVTVRRLNKNWWFWLALSKHFSSYVIQSHTL